MGNGSRFRARGSPGFRNGSPRLMPELTQFSGCLLESGLRVAIVGSAGLAVNRQERVRRISVVHGRGRYRLISAQDALGDDFRDGDLLDAVAHGAHSSDDHGAIRLSETFRCVLCRTLARAGAHRCHVPEWLRGGGGSMPGKDICGTAASRRVFRAIVDLICVRGRIGCPWAWCHRFGVGEVG